MNVVRPMIAPLVVFPSRAALLAFSILLLAQSSWAVVLPSPAQSKRGVEPFRSYDVGKLDIVNLFSGNLSLAIPVSPTYPVSAGVSFGLATTYNSKAWESWTEYVGGNNPLIVAMGPDMLANAGVGWRLSLGMLLRGGDPRAASGVGGVVASWFYLGPDGADHAFFGESSGNCANEVCYTRDGTYLRLRRDGCVRWLEFPDGSRHQFEPFSPSLGYPENLCDPLLIDDIENVVGKTGTDLQWQLTAVLGPSSQGQADLTIAYECPASPHCNPVDEAWVVEDRHGRVVRIEFEADPSGVFPALVDKVTVPTFGGIARDYDFVYSARLLRPACIRDAFHTLIPPLVPTLDRIVLPDQSFYAMSYHVGPPAGSSLCTNDAAGGVLTSLRLPAGGRVEWGYDRRDFPVAACEENVWTTKSPAVSQRTLIDRTNATLGTWHYGAALNQPRTQIPPNQPEECTALNTGGGTGPSEEMQVFVTDPNNDQTIHYFSAYPGVPLGDEQVSQFRRDEMGMPFSRCGFTLAGNENCSARRDGSPNPRFLSTEVRDCLPDGGGCVPARQTFVRFERDNDCALPGVPPCDGKHNQRLQSTKTRFLDDGGTAGATENTVDFSSFDSVGHYRVATHSSQGYGALRTDLVETTQWNGVRTTRPDPSERWLLNTFVRQQRSANAQTVRADFDHDPQTGFLLSTRRFVSTASEPEPSKADVIVKFTPSNDGAGFVALEEWFGGDCLGGVLPCPSSTTPTFKTVHAYDSGTRTSSVVLDGSSEFLKTLNLTIDDATGLTKISRDPGDIATTFDYDVMGRLKSIAPAGAAVTQFTYAHPTVAAPSTQPMVTKEVIGSSVLARERWVLDGLGREIRHEVDAPEEEGEARVNVQFTKYHAAGWRSSTSEWTRLLPGTVDGPATEYSSFDPFGRPRVITRPDQSVVSIAYSGDRIAQRTSYVWTGNDDDPRGESAITIEQYDNLGQLRQVTEPNARKSRYEYDPAGRLKHARPVDSKDYPQNRFFEYDGRGFLKSETHPESGKTNYLYDALGNAVVTMSPAATLRSAFDKASRPTEVRAVTGQGGQMDLLRKFDYFGSGSFEGKLQSARAKNWRPLNGACQAIDIVDTFGYDAAGRTSSKETQLIDSGVAREKWLQSYGYDGAGQLTSVNYPNCVANCTSTARTLSTTYSFGRPKTIASGALNFASDIKYAGNGIYTDIAHGNGTHSLQMPDLSGMARPGAISVSGSGSDWGESYAYDESGNIKSIGNQSFTYDRLSRLRSAIIPGALAPNQPDKYQSYSYDRFGNLVAIKQGPSAGAATTVTDFVVDPKTNRLGAGPGGIAHYTASGSLKSSHGYSFVWDPLRQLASLSTGPDLDDEAWTHTYDASGERVWSWRGTQTRVDTYALRGLDGKILREFKRDALGPVSWEDYVYREGSLLATVKPGALVRHFHLDHLGSVRLITNGSSATKHQTWPYGAEFTSQADGEQMRFTGHERDLGSTTASTEAQAAADDLDYMHARYYKPIWGRFLSVDPKLSKRALKSPNLWNRYAYAGSNPLVNRDPTGMYICSGSEAQCKSFEGARQASLGSPRATADVKRAVGAYGDPGKDNGITVQFGPTKKGTAATTAGHPEGVQDANGNYTQGARFVATVTISPGLKGTALQGAVAHEGSHVADGQAFASSFSSDLGSWTRGMNLTGRQSEMGAYAVSAMIASMTNDTFRLDGGTFSPGMAAAQVRAVTEAILQKSYDPVDLDASAFNWDY